MILELLRETRKPMIFRFKKPQTLQSETSSQHATRFLAQRWILSLCIAAFLAPAQAGSDIEVPYIGEPADLAMSPLQEIKLGREVMHQLKAHGYVLEDPELHDYVNSLGQHLLGHTEHANDHFAFFVIKDSGINAFALPGGFIGINAGLIMGSRSEDELAGVFAHEIAHVTQRHIARQINKTQGWDIATAALLIAAIIAGAQDAEVAQAAISVGMSVAQQQQIDFTRAHEIEADRVGIRTLEKAGFNPLGMASFFQYLSQQTRLYGEGPPELLRTHPVTSTRISEARARAGNQAELKSDNSSLVYRLMQARTRVLMTEFDSEALAYFRDLHKDQPDNSAYQYGLSLALDRNRAHQEAQVLLSALLQKFPEQRNLQLAQGRSLRTANKNPESITRYRKTLKKNPAYRPAVLALADSLIYEGRADDARNVLLESPLILSDDDETFRLLALAARDMQQPAEAHFQMAAYERNRGNYVGALRQLHNGLRLKDLSGHDRKRIQGRLMQYNDEAPQEARERAAREAGRLRG